MCTFQSVGWSALFYAVSGKNLEITRMLIAGGAYVLLKDKVLCCAVIKYHKIYSVISLKYMLYHYSLRYNTIIIYSIIQL